MLSTAVSNLAFVDALPHPERAARVLGAPPRTGGRLPRPPDREAHPRRVPRPLLRGKKGASLFGADVQCALLFCRLSLFSQGFFVLFGSFGVVALLTGVISEAQTSQASAAVTPINIPGRSIQDLEDSSCTC